MRKDGNDVENTSNATNSHHLNVPRDCCVSKNSTEDENIIEVRSAEESSSSAALENMSVASDDLKHAADRSSETASVSNVSSKSTEDDTNITEARSTEEPSEVLEKMPGVSDDLERQAFSIPSKASVLPGASYVSNSSTKGGDIKRRSKEVAALRKASGASNDLKSVEKNRLQDYAKDNGNNGEQSSQPFSLQGFIDRLTKLDRSAYTISPEMEDAASAFLKFFGDNDNDAMNDDCMTAFSSPSYSNVVLNSHVHAPNESHHTNASAKENAEDKRLINYMEEEDFHSGMKKTHCGKRLGGANDTGIQSEIITDFIGSGLDVVQENLNYDATNKENFTVPDAEDEEEAISIVHAQLVDSASEKSDSELLLITDATEVPPLYKQKRVWCSTGVVAGAILLAVFLSKGSANQTSFQTAMPSVSNMPSPYPSASPTSNEDVQRNVLLSFFNLFGGENWTSSSGWGSRSSSNMCGWHGVSCGTDGFDDFVQELSLPANNLTGNIEDLSILSGLHFLRKLDLDSNSLSGNVTAISSVLAQMPNLKELDLRLNELTGIIVPELCGQTGDWPLRVDCDIECDCCKHEELCGGCTDVFGWVDSYGDSCIWYETNNACGTEGHAWGNDNHTANTACCECGGGELSWHNPFPSSAPSPGPTPVYYAEIWNALVSLYESTNGTNWVRNTNWLSDGQFCDWVGVQCSSEGDVVGIHMENNNMQGELPTEIGLLSTLDILAIDANSIHGAIPSELGLVTSLRYMYIFNNYFSGAIPTEIGQLKMLKELSVSYNDLTGPLPSELGLSENLSDIKVYNNHLTGIIPSELGLLASISSLYVETNSLTGQLPHEVCERRDINNGTLSSLSVDCGEVVCTCCTWCCVDGVGCTQVE